MLCLPVNVGSLDSSIMPHTNAEPKAIVPWQRSRPLVKRRFLIGRFEQTVIALQKTRTMGFHQTRSKLVTWCEQDFRSCKTQVTITNWIKNGAFWWAFSVDLDWFCTDKAPARRVWDVRTVNSWIISRLMGKMPISIVTEIALSQFKWLWLFGRCFAHFCNRFNWKRPLLDQRS